MEQSAIALQITTQTLMEFAYPTVMLVTLTKMDALVVEDGTTMTSAAFVKEIWKLIQQQEIALPTMTHQVATAFANLQKNSTQMRCGAYAQQDKRRMVLVDV